MRIFVLTLICFGLVQSALLAQENPFLRIDTKRNFFNQKVEILDGPKPLSKQEVTQLLADEPEALMIYQKALRRQTITTVVSVFEIGLFVGSTYLVFAPQQQSSTVSNLFWPIMLGTVVSGIASGVLRRDVRNLTREAVDIYNFGNQTGPPVYFQENRIDQPIFSFKIPLNK